MWAQGLALEPSPIWVHFFATEEHGKGRRFLADSAFDLGSGVGEVDEQADALVCCFEIVEELRLVGACANSCLRGAAQRIAAP